MSENNYNSRNLPDVKLLSFTAKAIFVGFFLYGSIEYLFSNSISTQDRVEFGILVILVSIIHEPIHYGIGKILAKEGEAHIDFRNLKAGVIDGFMSRNRTHPITAGPLLVVSVILYGILCVNLISVNAFYSVILANLAFCSSDIKSLILKEYLHQKYQNVRFKTKIVDGQYVNEYYFKSE